MKKFVALMLALVMVLALCACGGNSDPKPTDEAKDYSSMTLDQLKAELTTVKEGKLTVATSPDFAPYEFYSVGENGDATLVGFDIAFAKYIADKLGVDLKITALDFTAVLAGIADGKYDMAISAIAYSPSRAEAMRLSNVYKPNSGGYGFLTRAEDVDKYSSVEDLKDAVVITQSGSVQESLYNQNVKACKEFKLVANMTDGYLAVAEGKADVCICSTESAQLYAEANGGLAIPDFRFEVDPNMNGTVVAMPLKGSESLLEVVNEAIAELNAQGKIDQWNEEYTAYAAQLGIS